MMSRRTSKIRRLEREVRELALDVQAIIDEHDSYTIANTEEEVRRWFNSLPIESLNESLRRERGLPRTRPSLQDLSHRFSLRREHERTKEAFEQAESDLAVAKIELVMEDIAKVEKKL
jgi:hypothetical protein